MFNIFLKPSDPNLIRVSKEIPDSQISSKETREIIDAMLKIAYGERKNNKKPVMVGLAAPQIGILKRIILIDVKANGKGKVGDLRVYINPQITWASKQKGEWYEGCYSTSRVCGIVKRPVSIKVRAYIPGFKPTQPRGFKAKHIEEKYTGYVARIFQHEIDHLNGKVFVDRITNPDNLHWVKKSEFPLYRNEQVRASGTKQAWRNWSKKCSFKRWKSLKSPLLKIA